ncbi:MAG: Crp/Fnr family transcriptional regulator [Bacteroidales bacterium]|nr:Crp/Fnr family transcriptional regulator [Bacteroidales bacterium]
MISVDFKLPAYEMLSAEQLARINDNSLVVRHAIGEFVYSEDKPITHFMYLQKGLIKIFKNEAPNRSTILKIVGSGSYVGLFSAFSGTRYPFSAVALEDSEVICTNLQVLAEVLTENGGVALQFMRQFSEEGVSLFNKLIDLPKKQLPGRIAEVLLFFSSEIYGMNDFKLPLSRQELADLVYSTRESVSRTLTEFKNDKMIEIDDRFVSLKSIDLLKILSKLG